MAWTQRFLSPLSRAFLALCLVLSLTFIIFVARYQLESDKADIDFMQRANVRIAALTGRINASIDSLRAVNQLFMVNRGNVTREQFREFTRPYLVNFPYVQSFVFHRLVPHAERKSYEANVRKHFPGFGITELRGGSLVPAAKRELYLVDDYVEPLQGNEVTFGYDALSDPEQAATFWLATDTGRPVATRLKSLVQVPQKGFTIMMPVYRQDMPLVNAASRRAAVIGDTEVVFVAENLIAQILKDTALLDVPGIHINVYATDGIDEERLAFRNGSRPPQHGRSAASLPEQFLVGQPRNLAHTFDLAGKPWHIVVSSPPPPLNTVHFGSLLVLLAGILLSAGVAGRVYALATQSRRIENLVRARTAELRKTAAALELRQRAIEASPNAILIVGAQAPEYPVEYANPAFERITGYPAVSAIGKPMLILLGENPNPEIVAELKAALEARQEAHTTFKRRRKDGSLGWNDVYIAPVKDEIGIVHHYVCMQYDVTATKRYEEELEFRANYDTLTGLANRNLLRNRLVQSISYASRYRHPIWVVLVDLDRFKFVNESRGRHAGDALLKIMADRLRSLVGEVDTVARLGGDEFVLILPGDPAQRGIPEMLTRLLDEIAKPAVILDREFITTCSAGIAVYPDDGEDLDFLISHADVAMLRAKKLGGNNFKFFEASMNESARKRLQLEGDLRRALDNGEFMLHYQPKVDLRSGSIVGVEALIRWRHPDFGFIPPPYFISLAEETGLIVQIGKWALHTACAQNKAWQSAGIGTFSVAVNLSAIEFAQPDFVQTVTAILAQTRLDPACLEIEMTESMVMQNVETVILKLQELKSLGMKISVDDFGTGYSSLSYLTRFPIDVLKIDQSFVRDIATQANSAMLVTSIISIAHNLRLRVIAEGVETPEQLQFLRANGCDEIQGFYCSKPLAASGLEALLCREKNMAALMPRS